MARLRTHPGEVLREEYLLPLGLSARELAKACCVPTNRVTEIMRGTRDVSADTAIRLGLLRDRSALPAEPASGLQFVEGRKELQLQKNCSARRGLSPRVASEP